MVELLLGKAIKQPIITKQLRVGSEQQRRRIDDFASDAERGNPTQPSRPDELGKFRVKHGNVG
jgi:hypothetical protein